MFPNLAAEPFGETGSIIANFVIKITYNINLNSRIFSPGAPPEDDPEHHHHRGHLGRSSHCPRPPRCLHLEVGVCILAQRIGPRVPERFLRR